MSASLVFAPLGLALAGPVASLVGLQATMIGSGIFGVIAVAAIVAVPDVRNIRRGTEAQAVESAAGSPSEIARGGADLEAPEPRALAPPCQ